MIYPHSLIDVFGILWLYIDNFKTNSLPYEFVTNNLFPGEKNCIHRDYCVCGV